MRKQQGVYLVLVSVLLVVLVGIAALVLDIGRILALRTEMQSAVDAAALAAAAELDQDSTAIERAKAAARELLSHDSRFAKVAELLGSEGLPDEAFVFYCVIGSTFDVSPDSNGFADFCHGGQIEPNKYLALSSADAHYVRLTLDPELVTNADRFTAGLFFLPVITAGRVGSIDEVGLKASAVAGRAFFMCNFPPMALCDPFEQSGSRFRDEMTVGGHIQIKQQGANQWFHGNFGFLEPAGGGSGAGDVAEYIADEGKTGCAPPVITTKPGNMSNVQAAAFNTRFDQYTPPAPFNKPNAPELWPPAPNIMEYPHDATTEFTDSRFGLGDWDFDSYWASYHPTTGKPNGWSNMNRPTRWAVYNWEIENEIPAIGQPDPEHLYSGEYPPPRSIPERRLLHVAVLSCEAMGLSGGKSSGVIFAPDGFAKMFLIDKAEGPPVGEVYAEYLGWASNDDSDYHVEVQLYE